MRNNPCKTELKVARSQRNRLRTIEKKLTDMSSEWDGLSGWRLKVTGWPERSVSICRHWKNNFRNGLRGVAAGRMTNEH